MTKNLLKIHQDINQLCFECGFIGVDEYLQKEKKMNDNAVLFTVCLN